MHDSTIRPAEARSRPGSILYDVSSLAGDVEAELEELNSPRNSVARNLVIVVGTLLVFGPIESMGTSLAGLAVLIVVLLVHEAAPRWGTANDDDVTCMNWLQ